MAKLLQAWNANAKTLGHGFTVRLDPDTIAKLVEIWEVRGKKDTKIQDLLAGIIANFAKDNAVTDDERAAYHAAQEQAKAAQHGEA